MHARYQKSYVKASELPDPELPEILFLGRSNVGKSSLLNALCEHNSLARVSKSPGRTRMANFFRVNDAVDLIDLPGYGFAKGVAKEREHWSELVDACLHRPSVTAICLLIDIRRKLNKEDYDIIEYLLSINKNLVRFVFTKLDKMNQKQAAAFKKECLLAIAEISGEIDEYQQIYMVSSLKKTGIKKMQQALFEPYFKNTDET